MSSARWACGAAVVAIALLAAGCDEVTTQSCAADVSGRGSEKVKTEKATFAAGCFWHVEDAFRRVDGVISATSGYTGGDVKDPTYDDVCSGETGHAEAVLVEYDPARVTYEKLLETFWRIHDASEKPPKRKGDRWQYRSAVFYHSAEQRAAALAKKRELEAAGRTVVTAIVPASRFYRAEEYHQRYYEKHRIRSCPVR